MDPAPGSRGGWRRALRPLTSVSTLQTGVYLVLGGVVAGAYGVLVTGFAQMFAAPEISRVALAVLVGVTAAIVLVPPFLGAVRTLEILAVRTFLGVEVPVPRSDGGRLLAATRWRAAAWYGLHLAAGAAATLALLLVVPLATQLVLVGLGLDQDVVIGVFHEVGGFGGGLLSLAAALVLLLALPYAAALVRVVLRQAALPLLGPDQSERIAELEATARRAVERNRLARELHDSVGHALTVTTLQAAAAARQIGSDDDAARQSLAAIEATGRAAMADLDHVLGLLRDPGPGGAAGRPAGDGSPTAPAPPVRTLADVPRLVEDVRRTGADVALDGLPPSSGTAGTSPEPDVPQAVSREAYRIVQESVTNALRHAPGTPVAVRVTADDGGVEIEVTNPLAGGPPSGAPRTGRGTAGMAERVGLLGGTLEAGPRHGGQEPDRWVVRARFGTAGTGAAGSVP